MSFKEGIYLLGGVRTPIGSFGKTLVSLTVDKLVVHNLRALERRLSIDMAGVDGFVLGHAYQSAYTPNTARFSWLNAGLPASTPAMTIQRQCGSGLEAAAIAAREIECGNSTLMIAGGAESMSNVPYLLPGNLRFKGPLAGYFRFGPRPVLANLADDGLVPTCLLWDLNTTYMPGTAQRLADTYAISREEADIYALRSQQLASKAIQNDRFTCEIEPVPVGKRKLFAVDEHPRANTSLEKLASLPAVLKTKVITAGNSSGINDGACLLVLAGEKTAHRFDQEPLARIMDVVAVGVDPEQMGLGPVVAIRKILERNGLALGNIDLFEINEAFAAQYLACEKLLGLNRDIVNINGGAIALGHPIGMSGARLLLTLGHEMQRRGAKLGIASLCVGGGMGVAALLAAP